MRKDQIVKVSAAVVLLGLAAVVFASWLRTDNSDVPLEDPAWLCLNPACKHEFVMSAKEQLRLSKVGIPCPKCGSKETTGAFKCPNCSRLCLPVEHGSRPETCSYCKQKFPRIKPPTD